jgi:hypothetical protein
LERGYSKPRSPEQHEAAIEMVMEQTDLTREQAEVWLADQLDRETWLNHLYVVIVERAADGGVSTLSIRRQDRAPEPFPWRHLQAIKNQLAGPDAEAIELFPAENRVVDTANQRWLWCAPPGERFEIGFNEGRIVTGADEAARIGAVQAEPEGG